MKRFLQFFLLMCLLGCSKQREEIYYVGIDPSFSPLNLMGKEANVMAFCNELLEEISSLEGCRFRRASASWNNIFEGLTQKKYPVAISSTYPYVFNEKLYAFSAPFLLSGPVLIVAATSKIKGFNDLDGAEVITLSSGDEQTLVTIAPGVIPREGMSLPEAMLDLSNRRYDALFTEGIPAVSYVKDLYPGVLQIVTPPYGDTGLRFISLQPDRDRLIPLLNRALEKLRSSGRLAALSDKWKVSSS